MGFNETGTTGSSVGYYGTWFPQPQPCGTCGRCPTCGAYRPGCPPQYPCQPHYPNIWGTWTYNNDTVEEDDGESICVS